MNLNAVYSELTRLGWKGIQPGNHMGYDFEMIGERRFLFTRWNVLVKAIPVLDDQQVNYWRSVFLYISEKSKSWIWGRCFVMCLIADYVYPQVQQGLAADSFGLFGALRLKGGGGNMLMLDCGTRMVYGKVPAIPLDVHKFSKDLKNMLSGVAVA